MTGFASFMAAAGMVARVPQEVFAEAVADRLRSGEPVAVAAQAATGIGKTWALAFAAVEAAAAGRRVVWSTHTTLLRAQVLATLRLAVAAAGVAVVVHERRGRTDYPSAVRTRRLRHARKDAGADAEELAQLDALAAWQEPIAAFVAAHGDLRVPESLVRLTAACPDAEQVAYRSQRDAAEDAGIVVQTHALTLIEARFDRLEADLVIFDEADTLASVAAGAVEARLALADLEALAVAAAVDVAEPLEHLRARATGDSQLVWRDPAMVAAVEDIRSALGADLADLAPELAQAVSETAADLRHFATVDAPKAGAALLTDGGLPLLAVAAVDAAGWLGHRLRDRQTVLLSATLGRWEEDDLGEACRSLGFHEVVKVGVAPERFGEMRFRLADRGVTVPFDSAGTPVPAFFDYAASMVTDAAKTGRALVLCASYRDVEELAARLPAATLAQRRGERLQPLVDRFRELEHAVLLTPGAWAGLDLPGLIDAVVVVRLPMPRPDELREAILGQALERRGMPPAAARAILQAQRRGDTVRQLAQGMGRGVRTAEDRCTVWIADPRFPLPASAVVDLRRRLVQGSAAAWLDMARAIPRRFRQPQGRSAYDRAVIMPAAPARAVA